MASGASGPHLHVTRTATDFQTCPLRRFIDRGHYSGHVRRTGPCLVFSYLVSHPIFIHRLRLWSCFECRKEEEHLFLMLPFHTDPARMQGAGVDGLDPFRGLQINGKPPELRYLPA